MTQVCLYLSGLHDGRGHLLLRTCSFTLVSFHTGNTICNAATALKKAGARKIYAFSTHGVLSGDAVKKLNESVIDEICITDTIPVDKSTLGPKFQVMTLAPILAEVIHRIHTKTSVSILWSKSSNSD